MTSYDVVRYPTYPKPQTHPDRMAAIATLFGLRPAPVEHCRVLELGCGTGGNLIPMALGLPGSHFVGLDLAAEPVAEGCGVIRTLDLRNIELLAMDLMDAGPEFGEFDYIVVSGLYSWVPAAVREQILELCRRALAPFGVAFISYNAYPGFHLRRVTRDMMLYHTRDIGQPSARIAQARALARLLSSAEAGNDLDRVLLKHESERLLQQHPGALYHDDLADENTAFYFHEFAADAGRHGLQYLSDVDYYTTQVSLYGEGMAAALQPLADDEIRRQQYLDFIRVSRFRQTLLCHAGLRIERDVRPAVTRRLLFACSAREDQEGRFEGRFGAAVQTVHPLARAALEYLISAWPKRCGFEEILRHAGTDVDAAALEEILLGCFSAGLVEAHVWEPPMSVIPGDRPVASPLARLQLRTGTLAANLCHALTEVADEKGRLLVGLLDGTRGRAELAGALGVTAAELEPNLATLGRLALLLP